MADVKVRLQVDGTAQGIAQVRTFTQEMKSAGREAQHAFEGVHKSLGGVEKLLGAVGIGVAMAELVNFTKETIAAGYEQKHLAEQVGTTVGHMSAMSTVARLTNTETKTLGVGLGKLAQNIDNLKNGSVTMQAAFGRLGLSAKSFPTNDTIANAEVMARAFAKVENNGTKTALAMDTMGRSGRAMLPVFEKLVEMGGVAGATDYARKTGFYVDEANVAMFERLVESMAQFKLYAMGATSEFLKGFGPQAVSGMNNLFSTITTGGKSAFQLLGFYVGAALNVIMAFVASSVLAVDDLFTRTRESAAAFKAWMSAFVSNVLNGVNFLTASSIANVKYNGMMTAAEQRKKDVDAKINALMTNALRSFLPQYGPEDNPERVWGSKRPGAPGTSSAGAPAAPYDATKDYQKNAQSEMKVIQAADAERAAWDKLQYEQGLISLEEYFARRRQMIKDDWAARRAVLVVEQQDAIRRNGIMSADAIAIAAEITAGDVATRTKLVELEGELLTARGKAKTLAMEVRGSLMQVFSDFFSSGINQAKSFSDALRMLALDVVMLVQKMAALRLAKAIVSLIPTGSKSSSTADLFGPNGYASGGYVSGPGTGTSDSIPARLSHGEFVVPARVVSAPGMLQALESMRRGLSTPRLIGGVRGYADGGLVSPASAGPVTATLGGHLTLGLDEGLILKTMESPAGQRVAIKVAAKNRRAFGQATRG